MDDPVQYKRQGVETDPEDVSEPCLDRNMLRHLQQVENAKTLAIEASENAREQEAFLASIRQAEFAAALQHVATLRLYVDDRGDPSSHWWRAARPAELMPLTDCIPLTILPMQTTLPDILTSRHATPVSYAETVINNNVNSTQHGPPYNHTRIHAITCDVGQVLKVVERAYSAVTFGGVLETRYSVSWSWQPAIRENLPN